MTQPLDERRVRLLQLVHGYPPAVGGVLGTRADGWNAEKVLQLCEKAGVILSSELNSR